jgi:hypothetical protein
VQRTGNPVVAPSDPKEIFKLAEAYRLAYNAEKRRTELQRGVNPSSKRLIWRRKNNRQMKLTMATAYALSAFAVELLMKCLCAMDGGKLWGHKLKTDLFDKLSLSRQQEIRKRYNRIIRSDPLYQKIRRDLPTENMGLDKCLKDSNEAFEEYRYVFENRRKPPKPYKGTVLIDILRGIILEEHPAWRKLL